jgi:hypothetical protein
LILLKGRMEAITIFEAKYGQKPDDTCEKANYIRKGIVATPKKRETLSVTIAKDAPFIAKRGTGIHIVKGIAWKVSVNFTEKDDTVYVFYTAPVSSNDKKSGVIQKPTAKFLPLSSLKEVKESVVTA